MSSRTLRLRPMEVVYESRFQNHRPRADSYPPGSHRRTTARSTFCTSFSRRQFRHRDTISIVSTDFRIARPYGAPQRDYRDRRGCRNAGAGFEAALLNLPITEGAKLRTAGGFAEVEFEDGTTLRITPFTTVEFDQLHRNPNGSTVTAVNVETGTAYVSMEKAKGNTFTLSFGDSGDRKVSLAPSGHVRLFRQRQWVSVATLRGKVTTEAPTGNTVFSKKTMNFHLSDPVQIK